MYLPLLTGFFATIAEDDRITVTHIALYMALFECWHQQQFLLPFRVSRRLLMKMTKIRGKNTYHTHLRELVEFGYINYEPSYHPKQASKVWMLK